MIGFFNSIPTKIEINGPILSFTGSNTLQPISTTFCNGGSAGFVGYATATFPTQSPINPAENTGYIQYRWHEVGKGELSDSANVVGSATTFLTLYGLKSPQDNGRQFFLRADYVNSAYAIGKSTGNAINESLDSNIATLGVRPDIKITSQPTNTTTSQGQSATVNISATATDSSTSSLRYQWFANGNLLSNGKNSVTMYPSLKPTQTSVVSGWNGSGIYLDLVQFVGNINVTISTSEESGIFHYINIPGVANIPENLGTKTYTLQGGKIYGPCTAPNGNLYIGNETPVGGTNRLVVEEGGDDWNDMILSVSSGFFKRYSTAPTSTVITGVTTAYMTISDSLGVSRDVILSDVTSLSSFDAGKVYTITTNTNVKVQAFLKGGKGGTSSYLRSISGGEGGTVSGIMTFFAGETYKIVRASAASGATAGFPGGGTGDGGGGGGGYTGVFKTSQIQSNAILIAGGGGGGANDPETGGAGGGLVGGNGQAGNKGGTQSAGGVGDNHAGNRPGFAGAALQGGQGAAGGGGGYFGGGGGGGYPGCCDDWAGGGGSGYINSTLVTSGTFAATGKNNVTSTDGILVFDILNVGTVTSSPVTGTLTVSGATTPNLTLSCDTLGTLSISCLVSHPLACNSPLLSDAVSFQIENATQLLKIERIPQSGSSTATLTTHNLYTQGAYTFSESGSTYPLYSFYAAERDLDVFIDLYAGPGNNNGSFTGGQGGVSTIRLTLKKDVEYVLAGLAYNSPVFLYRQATLIAVAGRGGDAGSAGNGGSGGGINVAGGTGFGKNGGSGGSLISAGGLTTNGLFGSASAISTSALRSGDSNAVAPNGGRALSCPKGDYWRSTSPCSNLGNIQFRVADGTLITNSATIARGYKAGYGIRQTSGVGSNGGGNGGAGATGGSGGNTGGGGGGSGYTDGSVTVISTQQGGNSSSARMVIRSVATSVSGTFYVDSFGRILILSVATSGKDPSTLTKTTGQVLPGTDACIDDARWQNFLSLAETQDYRLTGTLDQSNKKITNATAFNIRKMKNANYIKLKTSLTNWQTVPYNYTLKCLAWDENSIDPGFGGDYSILSWSPSNAYGFGYYGGSSNSFFTPTTYSHFTANWWILPPGVPDFS